jgi:hypothetical protein
LRRALVSVPTRFVAKIVLPKGVLWLWSTDDCAHARSLIQRMIREGRVTEQGVILGDSRFAVGLERPVSDCLEVHVDLVRGVVEEVRVRHEDGLEAVEATCFLDEFAQGRNPVRFTDEGPPSGVPP